MADVQSNIHVNIDTSDALASLKLLQRQISAFHTQMSKSGTAASAVAANQAQNLMNSINATGQFQASMRTVTSSTEQFTNALEKNKLSSREYFRYTGAATKTFGRLFRSEFETLNKVARERVKDIQTQYIKMGRGANGALQAIAVRPLTLDMQNLGTQTAMAAQKQQLLNQLLKQGSTNLLNFGKNTQWAGRQLMVGFTVPLVMLGTTAAKTFMKLEEQAIRFKRVYGEMFTTAEETDAMLKQIQSLAKEYTKYGVAVEDTMKLAADAAAMGKSGAELTAQVAQATRLAVLGGVEQTQALETTISVTNAFGVASEDLANKIDFLNAVENQTVVSIEDLTIAIPKAGPVIQQLGGDVEDLAFFLTAMKEGGINASEGANALKSGLASLINPSEKASKMLAGLGINIKGIVEANKGDIKSTVVGFAQALDTLDPLNRARAIEQLFGKFQFSRLSTLFQNVTAQGTQAARVLALTNATTEELAILSQRELDKVQNTTTYKFKKTMEDLKVAIAPVGEQFLKALTPIVEFVGKILDKFNNLGEGSKKFITILTVALGGIGPLALMSFGLLANGLANIIKLFTGMRSVFNRSSSSTQILGQQTNYLTQEQLEASAVAASLDQVHQRLRQTFTSEATAVNALATAYQRAVAAQLGFTGPARGGAAKVKGLKKYSTGTESVPGSGSRDTVPTMLTPGEAVIPAEAAQDPANRPMIRAMISGQKVQGFNSGTDKVKKDNSVTNKTHVGERNVPREIQDVIKRNPYMSSDQKSKLLVMEQVLKSQGLPTTVSTKHGLMFTFPEWMNKAMPTGGVSKSEFMSQWEKLGPEKWKASGIGALEAKSLDSAFSKYLSGPNSPKIITDSVLDKFYRTELPKMISPNDPGYQKSLSLYSNDRSFIMGKGLGTTPAESTKILKNAVDKGFIKGFAIKEGFATGEGRKDKIVTKSATVTLNDGTVVGMNRLGTGNTAGISQKPKKEKTTKENSNKKVQGKERKFLTSYREQLSTGTGYSNRAANHLSGIHVRQDGKKVYVKPMIDLKSALAEQRATEIARKVHGLDAPKQTIKAIRDPQTGKIMYALESPFSAKFDPDKMSKTFTKEQYFKQLVAANLRGDKDLKKGNLGGNTMADPGAAGVFDRASGKKDFANVASMLAMGETNLSGVKGNTAGNSPFWFGNATADIAKSMTATEYDKAMKDEIKRVLPNLEKTVADFKLVQPNLNDKSAKAQRIRGEIKAYDAMVQRLKDGLKFDYKKLHSIHTSIAIKPDEVLQDNKTGKTSKPKSKLLPSGVKSDAGKKDTRMINKPKKGTSIRNVPKRGMVITGRANAPMIKITDQMLKDQTPGSVQRLSDPANALVSGAKTAVAEARAVGQTIGTTLSQSAAAASRSALYGTGPIDPDAKAVRRQIQKRQREDAVTQSKINKSKMGLYGHEGKITAEERTQRKLRESQARASKLAEKVAYRQSVISAQAAANAEKKSLRGRAKTFVQNRKAKSAERVAAGKRPGMGMAGGIGIASGVAMMGSMVPGKVGEVSQKIMMPLMGLSMILPMVNNKFGAVAVGLAATVGAIVALRMAFDNAQKKVLEEGEKFRGSTSAINSIAKFSGKVTASEQMDLRRKNSFSMIGPATGKTTYGEAFTQSEEGKALTKKISEQNSKGQGNVAVKDLKGQLSASIMSGALDMGQAKSLAMNVAKQAGDMSIGIKVIAELESLLGPNGENLLNDPLQVRLDMITENKNNMNSSMKGIESANPVTKLAGQKTMQIAGIGATALAGAGAGAGIGALIGSALGPAGTVVGAIIGGGIGAAAGAIGGYFVSKKFANESAQLGAAYAVDAKIAMEQNKQMLDSFDMFYEKKIEQLRLQGKINEAEKMQGDYIKERDTLTAAQGKLQATVVDQYNSAGGLQESMMSGMKKATTAKYKDDPNQLAYLDVVNRQARNLQKSGAIDSGQEFLIQAKMASGDIPPAVFRSLLQLATDNKDIAPKMMNIITKFSGVTSESISVAAQNILNQKGDINKTVQTKFVTRVEAFEKESDALDFTKNIIKLNNLNAVIPSDVMVSYYVDPNNKDQYDKLNKILDSIDSSKDLTADIVYRIMPEVVGTAAFDEAYFNTLTEDQQKLYTTTISTLINIPDPKIVASEDYNLWLKESGPHGGADSKGSAAFMIQKYKADQGYKAVIDNVQVSAKAPVGSDATSGSGSKTQSSPLDDLLKKLRDVRMNQIKVTEGFDASRKALDKLFGGSKTINVFSGIENDIRSLGGSQDLIELVVGMDPKEYEKQKNKLFKFDNKGNIIALKRDAKNIQEALASITLGDFNSSMEADLKAISNETAAFDKLAKIGVPVANAYELVSDKAIAAALANGANEKTINKLIAKYKILTAAQEKSAAVKNIKTDIDQFKKDLVQEERLRTRYNPETAYAIRSDENLRAIEAQMAVAEALLAKRKASGDKELIPAAQAELNKLVGDFNTRLNQLKSTIDFMQSMFDEGFSNAMQAFDAQETALQIKFTVDTKSKQQIIDDAENAIAAIQYEIDDKEAALTQIADQEELINKKYDERIKALDEVQTINASISSQQKGQLSLAEALTSGDIAAAARAAQEMRAQQAADAVTKEKDALEKSREFELARATGLDKTNGKNKTRKQLEEEIKKLQKDIFNIEEDRLEPAQEFIRLKEISLKKDIENITVLEKTKDAWEAIKNQVDLALIKSAAFVESMRLAITTVPQLIQAYDNQKANPNSMPIAGDPVTTTSKPTDAVVNATVDAAQAAADAAAEAATQDAASPAATPKTTTPKTTTPKTTTPKTTTPETTTPKTTTPSYLDADKNGIPDLIQKPTAPIKVAIPGTGIPGTGSVAKAFPPLYKTLPPAPTDKDKNGIPDNIQKPAVIKPTAKPLLPLIVPPSQSTPKLVPGTGVYNGSMFVPPKYKSMGGLIPKMFALGGFAKGTDTVPAMLTPGEFIMSKYAVDSYGVGTMKKINNGDPIGGTVYNNTYTLTVNAKTSANPNEIAQAVMSTIKQVDDRRIRGVVINGR